jgi:hypothetical protein
MGVPANFAPARRNALDRKGAWVTQIKCFILRRDAPQAVPWDAILVPKKIR